MFAQDLQGFCWGLSGLRGFGGNLKPGPAARLPGAPQHELHGGQHDVPGLV